MPPSWTFSITPPLTWRLLIALTVSFSSVEALLAVLGNVVPTKIVACPVVVEEPS